jgi:hypothetical protein
MEGDETGVERLTLTVRPAELRDWIAFVMVAVMSLAIIFAQ